MKWLAGALLTVVLLLQYRLWLSGDGVRELARLSEAVERQKSENEEAVERNSSSSPKSRISRRAWRPSKSARAASSA